MPFASDEAPPGSAWRVFRTRPWSRVPLSAFGEADEAPTMLSDRERKLYLWIAKDWAQGVGSIVDLGCFAGGSTACLAQGRQLAGRAQPIVAFDRFRTSEHLKQTLLYAGGVPPFEGLDILPVAKRLLAPFAPPVHFVEGEIEDQSWRGGPIEVLCVDAAKSVRSADAIAATFYRSLIPGRSLIVHQDFLHWRVPWIPAQMDALSECFVPVASCPRDTVVFLCIATPDDVAIEACRVSDMSDAALSSAIDRWISRAHRTRVRERLERQAKAIKLNPDARRSRAFKVRAD